MQQELFKAASLFLHASEELTRLKHDYDRALKARDKKRDELLGVLLELESESVVLALTHDKSLVCLWDGDHDDYDFSLIRTISL